MDGDRDPPEDASGKSYGAHRRQDEAEPERTSHLLVGAQHPEAAQVSSLRSIRLGLLSN